MTRAQSRERLRLSLEWVCNTLWLAQRREPELVQLQEERGSTGFPHYILSRAGTVPDADWAAAIYVMPPSLVEHLRQRCVALEPGSYLLAALEAGAAALRRLHPEANGLTLGQLARASRPAGQLPRAWWELPPGEDPHRALLWAAMTLREGRAYAHYQSAESHGLRPLELLLLTATWQVTDNLSVQRLFRWGDDEVGAARESLGARGWLAGDGTISSSGRATREAIEAATEAYWDHLLEPLSDQHLELLAQALPISA